MTTTTNGSERRPQTHGDRSEWQGYEWQVPLHEIVDCDKCSPSCRNCYYKCRGLPVAFKIVMIIVILSTTVLLMALIVRFGSFGPSTYLVGNGDQIQFSDDSSQNEDNGFSRMFCSSLSLTSASSHPQNFSSFAVMTKPMRSRERLRYTLHETILLNYGSYLYIVHTFDHTDTFSILGCVQNDYQVTYAILYVIHGDENYKKWQDDSQDCSSCYSRREIFNPCLYGDTKVHLTFSSTDIVYFAYTLEYSYTPQASLSLKFIFDRARFEMENIVDSCVNTTFCNLAIPLHTADIVIEQDVQFKENTNRIRTVCGARISIYFAFFVGVPVAAGIVLTCLGLILKRCQDDLIRDIERADRVREYQRYRVIRSNSSRNSTTPARTNIQNTVTSERSMFSSSSLSANRALSVSATVPLVQHEQLVGSLPDYNSLDSTQRQPPTNEPPPPTYQSVACETFSQSEQHDQTQPAPPTYDDAINLP
ncbi:uncharacterized protein LOC117101606 [Anneissia japonica]|uniref:uncharacterized protein LOC117101606 n=1 Tax=Anneissia japonica TaxID=1529436 RepID=UPI0014254AF3|nr:uncharacterized protein LOC117101606 [Anneissia japonica]